MRIDFFSLLLLLIFLLSCTGNEVTSLNEKVFSLTLNGEWEKGYNGDSILLQKNDEQLIFQTHFYKNELSEAEIKNSLLKLIEIYRQVEMQKSGKSNIGENYYGEINGIFMVRFIGNEENKRNFSVFIFGTTNYLLSVYFEKTDTAESEFEKKAGEIINKMVLKQ
ncbi:MAG: hypothetical protein JW881_07695 [Spirochaetales bacterium]|nr:hypothetical protein [Spirochaetales bacterium]